MWKKIKSIRIPGDIWSPLLVGGMLGTFTVLCITLPISRTNDSTLGESIFGKKQPRSKDKTVKRRRVTSESNWRNYYGSCPELKDDIKKYGKESFRRTILSLHETPGRVNYEETRQLFLNNVLIEKLTDGTPAFYNSNILGRYYRKDYFPYDS